MGAGHSNRGGPIRTAECVSVCVVLLRPERGARAAGAPGQPMGASGGGQKGISRISCTALSVNVYFPWKSSGNLVELSGNRVVEIDPSPAGNIGQA